MVVLYSATIFLSAFLIFLVQPMVGKMLLPFAGGAPAVWNTCMFFFQALVLAGYGYAHFSFKKFGVRRQIHLHTFLLIGALFFLPFQFIVHGEIPQDPSWWLLEMLFITIAMPFFVLACLAPILQLWFSFTGHSRSGNPFFLYAASNAGSFLALIAYPFLIEPYLDLSAQARLWAILFVILAILVIVCSRFCKITDQPSEDSELTQAEADDPAESIKAKWVLAAFIPSSMMLGVTYFLTTDIAPVPLLWVIPLLIYLGTFIIAFSSHCPGFVFIEKLALIAVLVFPIGYYLHAPTSIATSMPLNLYVLFAVSLYCHTLLAETRPSVKHLTAFYAWISVGGVMGGLFNAMIAPNIFSDFTEYPLAVILVAMLLKFERSRQLSCNASKMSASDLSQSSVTADRPSRWLSIMTGLLIAFSLYVVNHSDLHLQIKKMLLLMTFNLESPVVSALLEMVKARQGLLVFVGMLLISLVPLTLMTRLPRFNLVLMSIMSMLTLFYLQTGQEMEVIFRSRNFFGRKIVRLRGDHNIRYFAHGSTLHGVQILTPAMRHRPLAYFHPEGPVGDVFSLPIALTPEFKTGIIGLGIGSMAAYAKPGQEFTFIEIDPEIIELAAESDTYFTHVTDFAANCKIICGDGRLEIAKKPESYFDLIAVDAFSSDSIPVHLVTFEAFALYLSKLKPEGLILINAANRYLLIEPVVKAAAAKLGLYSVFVTDNQFDRNDPVNVMRNTSKFIVMSRSKTVIDHLKAVKNKQWENLDHFPDIKPWTDTFSSPVTVFNKKALLFF